MKLSESELRIMKLIWAQGQSISFSALMDLLARESEEWKKTTVATFLTRMEDKGVIRSEKQGHAKQYRAAISESEYLESQAKSFLQDVFGGDVKGLVSALLKQDGVTREDMTDLQEFWKGGKG